MELKIQKWGNSDAVRLPKKLLESLQLKTNDKVEAKIDNNSIVIEKVKSHKSLKERYFEFYQSNDIPQYQSEEIDWGSREGEEVW